MSVQNEQYYIDKQLFKMIEGLKDENRKEFAKLYDKLEETNSTVTRIDTTIRDYNSLREKLDNIDDRVIKLEATGTTKEQSWVRIWAVIGTLSAVGVFLLTWFK